MENEEKNNKKTHHLRTFAAPLVVAWVIGTFAFIYFYPQQLYKALENEIIQKGLGSGSGIPVNT
ncbi:MAG TPA: hypothetical protein VN665_00775, partial [Candidatus Paceibacterota bacterium]|nr:hypothetical protein [Candidatus Paceibacterota bacterium]